MQEHQSIDCEIGKKYVVEVRDRMYLGEEEDPSKCLESFEVEVVSSGGEETTLRTKEGCKIIASIEFMKRWGRVPLSVLRLCNPKSNER